MGNFGGALSDLRQGRHVRRGAWPDDKCLILEGAGNLAGGEIRVFSGGDCARWTVTQVDVLADDWEIVRTLTVGFNASDGSAILMKPLTGEQMILTAEEWHYVLEAATP